MLCDSVQLAWKYSTRLVGQLAETGQRHLGQCPTKIHSGPNLLGKSKAYTSVVYLKVVDFVLSLCFGVSDNLWRYIWFIDLSREQFELCLFHHEISKGLVHILEALFLSGILGIYVIEILLHIWFTPLCHLLVWQFIEEIWLIIFSEQVSNFISWSQSL